MSLVPLKLGPLGPPGYAVGRSGMRWLREDGAFCRAGEAVAYCNISLLPIYGVAHSGEPFPEDAADLQVALAPRVAGHIRRSEISSRGGFLDQLEIFQIWDPAFVLGHLERAEGAAALPGAEDELELLFMTGRRHAQVSEGRQGLLTGWHDRNRAWRAVEGAPLGSVLGLGICEMGGIMRGDSYAFLELFEAISGPAHAIVCEQEPMLPSARIVLEQTQRTKAQYDEIAADLIGYFAGIGERMEPSEWIFVASLLQALRAAPLTETHDVLSRTALIHTGPADAVVLSSHSEALSFLRHKRLGYTIRIYSHRMGRPVPNLEAWISAKFEKVDCTLDDIASDYDRLLGLVRSAPERFPRHVMVLNRMSSNGDEDLQNYAGFDLPLSATLANIFVKDLNLLLHDLAREPEVDIVDVDAITAQMGGQINMPDGVHGNGVVLNEVRAEILHILRARGVPGFGPAVVS